MTNTLILMRHGKAQRPEFGQPDEERQLTAYGKRALRVFLPHALDLVPRDATVQIWSSPAARAQQTARVVLKACKQAGVKVLPEVLIVDALWSQNFGAFTELADASDADIVFAVGHNPFIETALARLTGSQVCFATGAFAACTFTDESTGHALGRHCDTPGEADGADGANAAGEAGGAYPALTAPPARLLWFVQGPISSHWKTLTSMERTLGEAAQTVSDRLEAFLADPDDVETMHKFRVSIRTLRSLLAFVSPWQQRAQNKSCQSQLRSIVRKTSRLRELDVLAQMAFDLEDGSPELAVFCFDLAAQERARVYRILSAKRTVKAIESIRDQLQNVKWRASIEAAGLPCSQVRQRFDELAQALEQDMVSLDLADAQATHDVRKDAKRVRYDAERFEDLLGEDALAIAQGMEAHQDELGAICDARVNIDIIGGIDTSGLPDQVAQEIAALRAQNQDFLDAALREG